MTSASIPTVVIEGGYGAMRHPGFAGPGCVCFTMDDNENDDDDDYDDYDCTSCWIVTLLIACFYAKPIFYRGLGGWKKG